MIDYSTYKDSDLLVFLHEPKPVCEDAFNEIYIRHANRLFSYCRHNVKDFKQAQDIFQDIWFRFIKATKKKTKVLNIQMYLMRIAHSLICNYYKKHEKKNLIIVNKDNDELDKIRSSFNFQTSFENDELVSFLKKTLISIEDTYREAYSLKTFNGLSFEEISELTGETVSCIQKRYSRATKMLKEILEQFREEFY